jgi:hypothetical protein
LLHREEREGREENCNETWVFSYCRDNFPLRLFYVKLMPLSTNGLLIIWARIESKACYNAPSELLMQGLNEWQKIANVIKK